MTLIEVIVAMAIVGILATIAYPLYEKQVRKNKRTEAKVVLSKVMQAEEQYRSQYGVYADNPAKMPQIVDEINKAQVYSFNGFCDPADCTGTVTLIAKAINGQEKDDCIEYTLTSSGVKGFTPNASLTAGEVANLKCW